MPHFPRVPRLGGPPTLVLLLAIATSTPASAQIPGLSSADSLLARQIS